MTDTCEITSVPFIGWEMWMEHGRGGAEIPGVYTVVQDLISILNSQGGNLRKQHLTNGVVKLRAFLSKNVQSFASSHHWFSAYTSKNLHHFIRASTIFQFIFCDYTMMCCVNLNGEYYKEDTTLVQIGDSPWLDIDSCDRSVTQEFANILLYLLTREVMKLGNDTPLDRRLAFEETYRNHPTANDVLRKIMADT